MKYIVSILMIIFILLGCENKKIRIGYYPWVGYQPIEIAKAKHFFEKEGITVQLFNFESNKDLLRAYENNKLDAVLVTTNEALILADKGKEGKIVLIVDYSNGADAIIAHQPIHSVSELKGKNIALETKSPSHFMLNMALAKAKLSKNDVRLTNIDAHGAIILYNKGSVDAVVTWAPYTDSIKKNGNVIFSSRDIPGEIIDVLLIKKDFIDKYPSDCYKLVSAYLNAVEWLKIHFKEGSEIIGNQYGTGLAEFLLDVKDIKYTGLQDNLFAFGTSEKGGTVYSSTEKLMDFLLNQEVIKNRLNINELIDPTFLWEYSKQYDATHSQ